MTYNIRETPQIGRWIVRTSGDSRTTLDWWTLPNQKFFYSYQMKIRDYEVVIISGDNFLPGDSTVYGTMGHITGTVSLILDFYEKWKFGRLFEKWKITGINRESVSAVMGKFTVDIRFGPADEITIEAHTTGRGFFGGLPRRYTYRIHQEWEFEECIGLLTNEASMELAHNL